MTVYEVLQDNKVLFSGKAIAVREWIEDKLMQSTLGFYPMLQENEEEEELELYLHSEWAEDLEEDEIEKVEKLGLNEFDSLKAIQHILNITICATRKEIN